MSYPHDLSALLSGNLLSSGDALASAAARNNSLLSTLLLQRQAEEQRIASQLAALSAGGDANLALLWQQQQQLEKLQALQAMHGRSMLGFGLPTGAPAMAGLRGLAGLPAPTASTLDHSKLLAAAAAGATPAVAGLDHQSALLRQEAALPLPPNMRRKGRTGTFPQKLHQMLSDLERQEGGTEIASFVAGGRAFAVHRPREFVKTVMPRYFRMSRISSFQRQLNLYDFQRMTSGPEKGAYFHELFVQGRPILSTMMKRNKIKGVKKFAKTKEEAAAAAVHSEDEEEEEEV